MTYYLNCERAYHFAGMCTNGAAARADVTPGHGDCNPSRTLPALNFCGSEDGCYGTHGATLREQAQEFAAANGCTSKTLERTDLSRTSYCKTATGCPSNLPVEGCGITGLGHCWPDPPGAGDPQCHNQDPANVDASLYLLNFFNNLPGGSTWDK